jgi:hypothetical protein
MTSKILAAAIALAMGSGMAFAQTGEDQVMVNVDGEMVEVDVETAAEACGLDAETIQAQGGAEIAVCDIDQATADMHGIHADEES